MKWRKGIKLEERNKFNADFLYTKRTFKFPANSLSELYILKQKKQTNWRIEQYLKILETKVDIKKSILLS